MAEYDREAAVAYANYWAYRRNPEFYDYNDIGGDCTNFASQVLLAGGAQMDDTPEFGWYYIDANDKAPAWTGVEYLYRFLTNPEKRCGPSGEVVPLEELEPGDLIQLSFDGIEFAHTPIVVRIEEPGNPDQIFVAAHSYDADCRPLSTYAYELLRPIHITQLLPCPDASEPQADLRPRQF